MLGRGELSGIQRRINPRLGKYITLGMASTNAPQMRQLLRQKVRSRIMLSARVGKQTLRQRDNDIGPDATGIHVTVCLE